MGLAGPWLQGSARCVPGGCLFQVKKEWRAVVLARLLSATANTSLQLNSCEEGDVFTMLPHGFLFYILNIWAFFSLFLSPPLAPFFLFPSSSPSLQSALDHMVMEGHSSTANTNLQLSFIATVVSWVWKQENQIARKPGKSVSGKSGEQVCGSVNSCFFLPFLMINNLNDFFFLYSYWSEVWEGKKKCLVYLKS